MEEIFEQELNAEASKRFNEKLESRLSSLLVNVIMPTGMLPGNAQKWVSERVRSFKPKLASIASAIYMAAFGAYSLMLPSMNFLNTSSVNAYGLNYSTTIYDITLPSLLFQLVGAYLLLDAVRIPISYYHKPFGTLLAEGVLAGIHLIKLPSRKNKDTVALAARRASERYVGMRKMEGLRERNYYLSTLSNCQSSYYASTDPREQQALLYQIGWLRNRLGLGELKKK